MRKDTTLIVLGLLTALVQLLGIPASWKMVTTVVLGFCTMLVALSLRHYLSRVSERLKSKKAVNPVYVESAAPDSIHEHEVKTPQPTPTTRRRARQTV